MKSIILRLENIDGVIEKENEINIDDNDVLIMQYPKNVTLEQAHKAFDILTKALENNVRVIGLPVDLTFKVIKKS